MFSTSGMIRALRPFLRRHPRIKNAFQLADEKFGVAHHALAERVPFLIRPAPRQITIAITAQCNLRCQGCRYGRDFMVGAQLPLDKVRDLLQDAHAAGVGTARFFGGEPLLHPDLPKMIEHAVGLGMDAYITTNGTLLSRRIDELFGAGLRWMTIGFYGVGAEYDDYTQQENHFRRLEQSLATVREKYGDRVAIQLNFLLSRRSCNLEALRAAWQFARRYDLFFNVDPVSRTIPFFTNPDDSLYFEEEHRTALEEVVEELIRLRKQFGDRMPQSLPLLRALPDLLLKGDELRIPCDAYQMIWVGADGTVQLCDTHFKLGNVHDRPLREILFSKEHCRAARDGFKLECPTCSCKIDTRIRKHGPSLRRYGG